MREFCRYGCGRADRAFELSLSHPPHAGLWEVRALPERFVDMNILPPDAIKAGGFRAMPPVLRGYVRTGCMIGDGAVIDPSFRRSMCLC